jgi:serine/threonine protein kinase
VWGSPHYFAPEQARGEKPTPASDVYSIGIVLFEMLTGRLPYSGANQQELALAHIRDRIPSVMEVNPNIPDSLAKIVYKTMSKDAVSRYRMADQLGHILTSYRDRGRDTVTPAPARPTAPVAAPPQPVIPPPAPNYIPSIPSIPVTNDPTQRYDLAPVAPGGLPLARPQAPPPQSSAPLNTQPGFQGQSSQYFPPPNRARHDAPAALDVATIALAILAFFAVACLIPLYIAVFQARFG